MIKHSKIQLDNKDIDAVNQVLLSGEINDDIIRKQFEQAYKKQFRHRYAWATSTGTLALYYILLLLNLKNGDEVITTNYVCDDVLSGILMAGATPIISNFNISDFNIDTSKIQSLITRNTKAILVPHMFGMPTLMEKILEYEIPIIEDCSHSVGAIYKGDFVGNIGIAGFTSLHALKMIKTGEGGMIFTSDEILHDKKTCYDNPDFSKNQYRISYHMSNILAALGIAQLEKYEMTLKKRRDLASYYNNELCGISGGKIPTIFDENRQSSCYRYVIVLDEKLKYEDVEKEYAMHNIVVRRPVKNLLHSLLKIESKFFQEDIINFERIVSIPFYPELTKNEIDKVIKVTKKIML
ncbi:DegT/DnrJ/EryC1/StrS family aminotransferase [Acetoanaerobium noterae]|uniref:DegT/DnrJ/EryC1/StrS family aminotransferase n=1 Tax=Acetoanaerobium noterae TaxID=745369 RepID=UPI0033229C54